MTYTVVLEKTDTGFGIHVPDLPGCVATGTMRELVVERITEAIRIHLLGFREDGLQIPVPSTIAESITVESCLGGLRVSPPSQQEALCHYH
jgi:predicted RNase H-like HicB family nuclease